VIRKILRGILKPVLGKRKAAVIAEGLDGLAKKAIDSKTHGAATKLDDLV